jgi:hypothetical protein
MTDGASTASPAFIAYNNGYLHGAWTDADQDTNAIRAEINAMLAPLARSEPEADSAIADFRNGLVSIIGLHEIGIGLLHISDIRTLDMGTPCINRARWPCPSWRRRTRPAS